MSCLHLINTNDINIEWDNLTSECKSKLTAYAWSARKTIKPTKDICIIDINRSTEGVNSAGFNMLRCLEYELNWTSSLTSNEINSAHLRLSDCVIKNSIRDRQKKRGMFKT